MDRTIIAEVPYETTTPTVDSLVVQIKGANPDIFVTIGVNKFAAQAIKKIGELNWHPIQFLSNVAVSIPFNTLLLTGFLREYPAELEEAAIMDGAGLARICWSVVLPTMRPVIATILIFNVVYVFNEFPFVSILINNPDLATVSLAVSRFQGQYTVNYGGMMAAATLVLLPQLVIYALFQRHVIAGLTAGAIKG